MDILLTNLKIPSIHSESVPRSKSKATSKKERIYADFQKEYMCKPSSHLVQRIRRNISGQTNERTDGQTNKRMNERNNDIALNSIELINQ